MNNYLVLLICFFFLISCGREGRELFENPTAEDTGVLFENILLEKNDQNILDYLYFYNGGGVAVGDINNDELPDIFFSGNQVKNQLYLNKGGLKFENISEQAGVSGNSTWNTGSVMGDVNGDGLLDIYVCAVVGINGFNGHNELYINNGDKTFTERAAEYGLDYDSYSSSAAFLDYDLDGDLDMYLLNHAIHTQESYGKANLRYKRNYQTGDKLLRNDNGIFIDVSEEAGIFGGPNGYGLGVSIADFNQDGYPDIYIGNDFHEDDYYYLNNGNGTFSERLKKYFGHTSRFSMGNDVSDINHDGWPDLISLDMLPEDEKVLKSSLGDDNIQSQNLRIEHLGYHYQFTRNMLQVNQKNGVFVEAALMNGVAATDWSWSALFADYNQDGEQDLFISNGIPKRPNDLDYINFVSDEQIRKKISDTKLVDQQALDMMPSGAIHNYIFKGSKENDFIDKSGKWIVNDTLKSGATAFGDFDNDGDLDIVTNNINDKAMLYINKTNDNASYLKIKFQYESKNHFGIGTKVFAYVNGDLQYKELYTVRGFQASSEPIVHFGFGNGKVVDSIKIVWPNKTFQVLKNIVTNQTLLIKPENNKPFDYKSLQPKAEKIFELTHNNLGVDFTHIEDNYIDFNRQKLIPYQISDRGPAVALGDLNNDGKEDILFGGSKYFPPKFYIQNDSSYTEIKLPSLAKDSIKEDVSVVIADFNTDGDNDVVFGSGGADFYNQMKPLLDSYYIKSDTFFKPIPFPEYFENASIIRENDFDNDGDIDLFVGNNATSNDFGKIPPSYLLENKNGVFKVIQDNTFIDIGMVTDAIWEDFDSDGVKDLLVVGEWMSPKFFKNNNGTLKQAKIGVENLKGLWQCIIPFDIDQDGDTDYLLGNWGTNSKFKASNKYPLKMYYSDFDADGSTETIIAIEKKGKYYPIDDLAQLSGQMVSLRKKFSDYKSFAGKTIEEVIEVKTLNKAKLFELNELQSGYLKNNNGTYEFVAFPKTLQVAPLKSFLCFDFDNDGKEEVLVGGNYFGVKPFHGRFDSFSGALIKSEDTILMGEVLGLQFGLKSVRHLNIIKLKSKSYLLATMNNGKAQVYKLPKK
ncbi:VCBS repeat-containing protein [Cellulophaga sp. L1A9]|uniref:VCBS repeat-containing protein n=1 Tax=Cellulophaga sp. L1A9 TaxID=2686362 RepID=UPI00131A68FA|nr:VCBS repeat-containing protein [Cellulophaga sp. L1A9]